jgi:N-hydroxyarylamine O-acetyltransferase
MNGGVNLSAYFERIGFAGSTAPNLQTLELIAALHPSTIPFENLNPLLGLPVLLDQPSLEQKLLHDRRGGYCFEHNLLFLRVLRELEFSARGLAARVLWGHPEGADRPISHMVVAVDIGGTTHLADVGFGGFTLTAPLKLRPDAEQQTPNETFRLTAIEDGGFRLEVKLGEEWRHVYRFDLTEQTDEDYERLNAFMAADHRARLLLSAARAEQDTRYNLFRNRLTTHRTGADRERRELTSVAEIKQVLAETMWINLPPAELLDPLLETILALPPMDRS